MLQSHIIFIHTFVNTFKLEQYLAYCFFGEKKGFRLSLNLNPNDLNWQEVEMLWQKKIANRQIIVPRLEQKEDFSEKVFEFYQNYAAPTLFFLGDLDSYSTALQEGMLRFLEEPPSNAFPILFSRNLSNILPTIRSRCVLNLLKKEQVFYFLDSDLLDKVKKKLPSPLDFTKAILAGKTLKFENIAKLERDEMSFWLWQIEVYVSQVYRQNPIQQAANVLNKIVQAKNLNQQNLQKKFVLESLFL